ncbi:MAG: hypothetical protein WD673_02420 [Alphaproteobacteria bacterium]
MTRATKAALAAAALVLMGVDDARATGTVTCASPSTTFTRVNVREIEITQIGDMVAIEIRTRATQGEDVEFLALLGSASLCTFENVRVVSRP